MSDKIEINVKINGKEVPVSNISLETFSKIRDAEKQGEEKNAPVFSKVSNRLIIKMTPRIQKYFEIFLKQVPMGSYGSFEPDGGFVGLFGFGETWEEAKNFYSDETAEPLFEEN